GGGARAAGPRAAAQAGDGGTARDAAHGGAAARHPGAVVSGDCRSPAPAGRHREVAHQPRPHRARAADQEAARRRFRPNRGGAQTHGSVLMNVKTETSGAIGIVRVGETRLMYPILSDFSSAVSALIAAGRKDILIDMTPVTYVDSATIGCLMDLYRQVHSAGGHLKLSGVQKRVET